MEKVIVNINKMKGLEWSHKLGTIGDIVQEIEDIKQCYTIIVSTQKGSIVHNPNLGWNIMQYMSKPINTVSSEMIRELTNELNYQEPRAGVNSIDILADEGVKGKLKLKIGFNYKGKQENTEVDINW